MSKSILVTGNIGVGKTTFLKYLRDSGDDYFLVKEPVKLWKSTLKLLYSNPKKYAYMFQSLTYLTIFLNTLLETDKPFKILETSVFTVKHCFARNFYDNGDITDEQQDIYDKWSNLMIEKFKDEIYPDIIIYLYAPPDVCHTRIMNRNRDGEGNISIDYLKKLDRYFEEWLKNPEFAHIPIYTINITNGFTAENAIMQKKEKRKYKDFIKDTIQNIISNKSEKVIIYK